MQHCSSFLLPKTSHQPKAVQKGVRITFMRKECQIYVSYEKIKSTPYILFSRFQRGFNVTNISTEGNINESDISNGEFYMIRHSWH